jgi:hypothetical protein
MRRLSWVRIVRDGDQSTCEAFGIGHRRPVVRRVSLATALELAGQGVPVVVRTRRRSTAAA